LKQWYRAERWGLVVTPPAQLPLSADADALLQAAVGLERAEQIEAALHTYRTATIKYPKHALLWLGRGNSALATTHIQEAVEAFRQTLSLDQENGAAYHNLALALLEQGNEKQALEAVSAGLIKAKGFHEALLALAKRLRQNI